jgi:hypothetical protein
MPKAYSGDLRRLYGHGPRGVRLVDHVPFGNRKTFTFVAALRHNRMVAPLLMMAR